MPTDPRSARWPGAVLLLLLLAGGALVVYLPAYLRTLAPAERPLEADDDVASGDRIDYTPPVRPLPLLSMPTPTTVEAPKPPAALEPDGPPPKLADERIVLHTVAGDIVLALYPEIAPLTVAHMLKLAKLGAFDTTHVGRVEPPFVIQIFNAEDRLTPPSEALREALRPVKGEFTPRYRHKRGIISMGRADDPDSAVSSFSILLGDAPHIDNKFALFGQVEQGMDVVSVLERVPRSSGSTPVTRLTVLYAEVLTAAEVSQRKLEPARSLDDVLAQAAPPGLAERAFALVQTKCANCHGAGKTRGGFDVTTAAGLLKGGDHGPAFFPGNVTTSPLRQRVVADDKTIMPPDGALPRTDIALLTAWLIAGAPLPAGANIATTAEKPPVSAQDAQFWAFRPLANVTPPAGDKALSALDRFIRAKQTEKGLTPNPPADRRTLIRRLSFDLTGLPPEPAEVEAFVNDKSPDAVTKLIERLLTSPHFGERWARHWLDLARYADSGGYENDENRPHAWPYRDFVIRAFNDDLPYDQFLRWQLAGDELEPTNPDAHAATGFITAGPVQTFFMTKRDRYDELDDIVSTTGTAMLGLTVGCARCHDHKHDPIPSKDYYRLQAVFVSAKRDERYLNPEAGADYRKQTAALDKARAAEKSFHDGLKRRVYLQKVADLPATAEEKEYLRRDDAHRVARGMSLMRVYEKALAITDEDIFADPADKEKHEKLRADVQEEESKAPAAPTKGLCVLGSGVGRAFFLERGDPTRERDLLPPGFLTVLTPDRPTWQTGTWQRWAASSIAPQPRSALAYWLTDAEKGAGRLAARVIVNRLWQHYFGQGLVRTPSDFGQQGDRPSHPELLDWLADELIRGGWKLKPIHRLIVASATYQQSSRRVDENEQHDPENRLLARQNRRRLDADALRDAFLVAGGNLNRELYGLGVKPGMPTDAIFPTAAKYGEIWPSQVVESSVTWRRSLYVVAKRSNPFALLQLFDAPDTTTACATRSATTVPTQALALLNDVFVRDQAGRLAARAKLVGGVDRAQQVRAAFAVALGRPPEPFEVQRAGRFVINDAALTDFCQVLLQTNEFVYLD